MPAFLLSFGREIALILANPLPRSIDVGPGEEIRMEQVGKQFHSLSNPRPRSSEVRVSIYGVDLRV